MEQIVSVSDGESFIRGVPKYTEIIIELLQKKKKKKKSAVHSLQKAEFKNKSFESPICGCSKST